MRDFQTKEELKPVRSEADGLTKQRALAGFLRSTQSQSGSALIPGPEPAFLIEQWLTKTFFLLTLNRTAASVMFPSHAERRERYSTWFSAEDRLSLRQHCRKQKPFCSRD